MVVQHIKLARSDRAVRRHLSDRTLVSHAVAQAPIFGIATRRVLGIDVGFDASLLLRLAMQIAQRTGASLSAVMSWRLDWTRSVGCADKSQTAT